MTAILVDRHDAVLHVRFNRPERKNAFTAEMYGTLTATLRDADADRHVRAVLLHGGDTFTAGNDLRDFMERPPTSADSPAFQFMSAMAAFSKPAVAAVGGVAVGIGTTLLLHCDLVYAAEGARFQLPFVNLGLVPEFGSSVLLPRLTGHVRASELLLLGAPFDAGTALALGLINRVVAPAQLLATATASAIAVAKQPAAAVRATKALLKRPLARPVRDALEAEAAMFGERLASPEAAEAFQAFFDKRAPDFSRFD